MKILLDTHIALWLLADDNRLSSNARIIIEDTTNELYISTASIWEIAIKNSKRPDSMRTTAEEFSSYCEQAGIISLPIENKHIFALKDLPDIHNDPFDRLLLAQASSEGFKLMTHDDKIVRYRMGDVLEV